MTDHDSIDADIHVPFAGACFGFIEPLLGTSAREAHGLWTTPAVVKEFDSSVADALNQWVKLHTYSAALSRSKACATGLRRDQEIAADGGVADAQW